MPNASIVMTLQEDFSDKIERMRDSGGRFSKELDEIERKARSYETRLNALSDQQAVYTVQLDEAKRAMQEARRAFAQDDTEKNRAAVEKAVKDYTDLKNSLDSVTQSIRNNRQEYSRLNEDLRRLDNNNAAGGEAVGESGSWLSKVAGSGIFNMLGSSLSGAAGAYVGSAFDDETGSYVSGILGSAASGAAMGALAGPWGALIGAVAGGVSGLVTSVTEVFEQKDDAFISYVQDQYNTLTNAIEETLEAGSAVAGSREQTRLAFAQRFGSTEAADDYLARVQSFAAQTNYSYDEIVGYSKQLLNTYDPEEIFDVLTSLSDASAGLDLDTSDVNTLIKGLARMRTTGKATQEYLNYFSERGVDVYQALADSTGADKSEITDMVSKGDVGGADAARAILDYIDREFGGLSDRLAGTYDAMVDNLEDAKTNLDAAMGEGYNQTRIQGIQAEQDFYDSASGQMMETAYGMIGQWKASLENLKEEYNRDALTAVMTGEFSDHYIDDETGELDEAGQRLLDLSQDYARLRKEWEAGSEDAGAKMGALLAEAQAIAIDAYNASDGYKTELDSQMQLVENLRHDAALQKSYWDAGYEMGLEFTKGMAAAQAYNNYGISYSNVGFTLSSSEVFHHNGRSTVPSEDDYSYDPDTGRQYYIDEMGRIVYANQHAFGLQRVPHDDYPAILHRDERVLTAAEARSYDGGGDVTVTVTGNRFIVRDESDVDAIAGAIAEKVAAAKRLM